MTLPNVIQFPIPPSQGEKDPRAILSYLEKFSYVLSVYLQETNYTVNGNNQQVPFNSSLTYEYIIGSTTTGTATYSNTEMWAYRANLMNQIWFDITWAAHTGTGNLLIQLPYFSQVASNYPIVGTIENNGLNFTAGYTYLVGNLLPNTNTIQVNQCGSGMASIPMPLPANGSLRGSIIYAGQQNL